MNGSQNSSSSEFTASQIDKLSFRIRRTQKKLQKKIFNIRRSGFQGLILGFREICKNIEEEILNNGNERGLTSLQNNILKLHVGCDLSGEACKLHRSIAAQSVEKFIKSVLELLLDKKFEKAAKVIKNANKLQLKENNHFRRCARKHILPLRSRAPYNVTLEEIRVRRPAGDEERQDQPRISVPPSSDVGRESFRIDPDIPRQRPTIFDQDGGSHSGLDRNLPPPTTDTQLETSLIGDRRKTLEGERSAIPEPVDVPRPSMDFNQDTLHPTSVHRSPPRPAPPPDETGKATGAGSSRTPPRIPIPGPGSPPRPALDIGGTGGPTGTDAPQAGSHSPILIERPGAPITPPGERYREGDRIPVRDQPQPATPPGDQGPPHPRTPSPTHPGAPPSRPPSGRLSPVLGQPPPSPPKGDGGPPRHRTPSPTHPGTPPLRPPSGRLSPVVRQPQPLSPTGDGGPPRRRTTSPSHPGASPLRPPSRMLSPGTDREESGRESDITLQSLESNAQRRTPARPRRRPVIDDETYIHNYVDRAQDQNRRIVVQPQRVFDGDIPVLIHHDHLMGNMGFCNRFPHQREIGDALGRLYNRHVTGEQPGPIQRPSAGVQPPAGTPGVTSPVQRPGDLPPTPGQGTGGIPPDGRLDITPPDGGPGVGPPGGRPGVGPPDGGPDIIPPDGGPGGGPPDEGPGGGPPDGRRGVGPPDGRRGVGPPDGRPGVGPPDGRPGIEPPDGGPDIIPPDGRPGVGPPGGRSGVGPPDGGPGVGPRDGAPGVGPPDGGPGGGPPDGRRGVGPPDERPGVGPPDGGPGVGPPDGGPGVGPPDGRRGVGPPDERPGVGPPDGGPGVGPPDGGPGVGPPDGGPGVGPPDGGPGVGPPDEGPEVGPPGGRPDIAPPDGRPGVGPLVEIPDVEPPERGLSQFVTEVLLKKERHPPPITGRPPKPVDVGEIPETRTEHPGTKSPEDTVPDLTRPDRGQQEPPDVGRSTGVAPPPEFPPQLPDEDTTRPEVTGRPPPRVGTPRNRISPEDERPRPGPRNLGDVPDEPYRFRPPSRQQGIAIERTIRRPNFEYTKQQAPDDKYKEFAFVQGELEKIWTKKDENNELKTATVQEIISESNGVNNRANVLTLIRILDKLSLKHKLVMDVKDDVMFFCPFEPPFVTDLQISLIRKFENPDDSDDSLDLRSDVEYSESSGSLFSQ